MRSAVAIFLFAVLVVGGSASAAVSETLPQIEFPIGAPTAWQIEPARIQFGTSLCSPVFSKLAWSSWGRTGARARGRGLFPLLGNASEDCYTAAKRARPESVRLVLSRPRDCEGHTVFTRIGWRARGIHRHLVVECSGLVETTYRLGAR
jgi:hypothetical protein